MDLNIAIIGAGEVSRVHFEALKDHPSVQVIGLFDQDQDRARSRAAENGVTTVYPTWDALLADANVDCVAILLPHDLHEKFTIEALQAGKHVVCEKPLGQSIGECQRMLAAAAAADRSLYPVQNRLYSHAVERMGEIVHAGQIGDVIIAQTNGFEGAKTVSVRPWLATKRGGGGVLMAQAVHPAYALRWIIGDVASVCCQFGDRKVVDMTAEDTAITVLKFANGAVGEMTATFGIAHGPFDHSITLHGRDGYLQLNSRRKNPTQPDVLHAISPKLFGDTEMHEVPLPSSAGSSTGFRRMWTDYARGMVDGAPTRVIGEDGLRAVEIILASYRSNDTGQTMRLPLDVETT